MTLGLSGDIPLLAWDNQQAEGRPVQTLLSCAVSPDEEIWVIERTTTDAADAPADDNEPGSGCILTRIEGHDEPVPVPLQHTSVSASVTAYVASVDVTQRFHNPYDSKIEAVYVFPLPQNGAVTDFLMTVGDRTIRGIIRDRQEAEQIYREARAAGHVTSLMTQERPNIFTQKVANIEPGKTIDVAITYFNTLAYRDGWYEFVFPMVVGPRFNPPGTANPVLATPRGAPANQNPAATDVRYLRPAERSGHDISLTLNIDAGVNIEEIRSVNHAIDTSEYAGSRAVVKLSKNDTVPNKDFVLRYRVAGEQIKTALMTCAADKPGEPGYFTLMVYPPADLKTLKRAPLELIFVLDCSGSMHGQPIAQAKAAIERGLGRLGPDDSFQIIRFSNIASQLGTSPVVATPENVKRGLDYVNSLDGSGGTMMIEGIKAALDFPHDPERLRFVVFMTDGYIGNDTEIIGEVKKRLGAARVFSFGVGSSPNRYLLDRMAKLGSGVSAYLSLHESAAETMDLFFDRISHPAMTDVALDFGSVRVTDVQPPRLPDLFVGRPLTITGRYLGESEGGIKVLGRVAGEQQALAINANFNDASTRHAAIKPVWARMKIAEMADVMTHDPHAADELPHEIKALALDYNLLSAYTAFVAVDSLTITEGEFGTTVNIPVPVPEGVRYETTLGRESQ